MDQPAWCGRLGPKGHRLPGFQYFRAQDELLIPSARNTAELKIVLSSAGLSPRVPPHLKHLGTL